MQRPPKALVPILFAVLVVATAGAFAKSQHLKTQPLVLDKVKLGIGAKRGVFTPNGDCRRDMTRVLFRLTRPDRATVEVIRPDGRLIRTLVEDRQLRAYRFFRFWWDGLNDAGEPAETGPYNVRVRLAEQDRELVIGGRLRLHAGTYRPLPNCRKERREPPRRSDRATTEDRARQ